MKKQLAESEKQKETIKDSKDKEIEMLKKEINQLKNRSFINVLCGWKNKQETKKERKDNK